MHHLPGIAWIKDLRGRYVYANDDAVKSFRCTWDELYGKTDEEVFPPETAAQFKQNDRKALTSEAGVQVIETLEQEDGIYRRWPRGIRLSCGRGRVWLLLGEGRRSCAPPGRAAAWGGCPAPAGQGGRRPVAGRASGGEQARACLRVASCARDRSGVRDGASARHPVFVACRREREGRLMRDGQGDRRHEDATAAVVARMPIPDPRLGHDVATLRWLHRRPLRSLLAQPKGAKGRALVHPSKVLRSATVLVVRVGHAVQRAATVLPAAALRLPRQVSHPEASGRTSIIRPLCGSAALRRPVRGPDGCLFPTIRSAPP
jgi:hypothetical protein